MKIAPDHLEHLNSLSQPRQANQGPGEDLGFAKLLEEKSQTAANPGSSSEALSLLENNSMVGMIMAGRSVSDKSVSPDQQLESALDQMDQYASALGDSSRSLRDIEPLADGLKKTAGELAELSRRLPEGDPMKGLSNDAAVLATVEAMKFKRGDYV
jgi:hypothetical protein